MYPIHHDEPFARAAGYPTTFSVGMYQAGLVASWAVDWFGAENIRRFQARFKAPVWPGDILTCSGQVVGSARGDHEERIEVSLTCVRQTGELVVEASATFALPSSSSA
jgi:acyl dehydratase